MFIHTFLTILSIVVIPGSIIFLFLRKSIPDFTREKGSSLAIAFSSIYSAVPSVTLSTEGSAIEFAVSGGVVDGDDAVVNEPMQWVVVVCKNGKEIDRKTLTFEDGKQIATDDLKLYYK